MFAARLTALGKRSLGRLILTGLLALGPAPGAAQTASALGAKLDGSAAAARFNRLSSR